MEREELKKGLIQFGKLLNSVGSETEFPGFQIGVTEAEFLQLRTAVNKEHLYNPWFTVPNVKSALIGISNMLSESELNLVFEKYSTTEIPKRVAIIMAGNLPFVGFHDVLAVLVTGNIAICKFSSDDSRLPPLLLKVLIELNPELGKSIEFCFGPVKNFDAVIATGSNNTINSLKEYFKDKPAVFRKNRTSIAVLDGTETVEELTFLGQDCFQYFGMGCRNVGKIFVPKGFELNRIFEAFLPFGDIVNHHKYANNYDYHRTIFMMNQIPFLDNNSFMMKEDEGLHAPLSVIFYSYYEDRSEIEAFKKNHQEEIQIEVGHSGIAFGEAQQPGVFDFADDFDTFYWLSNLN